MWMMHLAFGPLWLTCTITFRWYPVQHQPRADRLVPRQQLLQVSTTWHPAVNDTQESNDSASLFGRNSWIQPFRPNQPRQNSERSKERNKFCPPNRRNDLCLAFCFHPSSMLNRVDYVVSKFSTVFFYNLKRQFHLFFHDSSSILSRFMSTKFA